jgi:cold shock CspA family protein
MMSFRSAGAKPVSVETAPDRRFVMQTPVEIAFRHYQPSDEARTEIAAQTQRLDKFSSNITSCRVVVSGPEGRRRNGGLFQVELRIAMPGRKDVIVDRRHGNSAEHEHVLVAIRQAFDAAKRQIEDAERAMRGEVKVHAPEDRGRVTKLIAGGDYGFIETADGREVYLHRNAVLNGAFDRLTVGDEVRFVEAEGVKGPQASSVRPVGGRRSA